ncbi:fha domain-containing protein [Cystoisospora suis]|uniref:Fha domain-containing protein n=1 Tax=Cystoisospora suis TaxID=483139 RepID=A0A2C6LGV2_9APIC|nr:fha domain-containing protein [Cystoisospora suis]
MHLIAVRKHPGNLTRSTYNIPGRCAIPSFLPLGLLSFPASRLQIQAAMATPLPASIAGKAGGSVDPRLLQNPQLLFSPANLAAAARSMYTRIDSFTGDFRFLSLDFPSTIFFQGRFFPSARHALLASRYPKSVDELSTIEDVKTLKKVSKEKEEDPGWKRLRLKWLEQIQRDKFRRHADLREKLKNTGGRELVWLNSGDSYFGQVGNRGQNHLGRILMEIRDNINEDTELESWIVICHDIETDEKSLPVLKLSERKEGETQVTEILLKGKSFYRIGKLPDNDLVALNPSISRRHAALVVLKGGAVLLVDLKSKAKTFKNGVALEHDHVGVQIETNDIFSLGTSTRHYLLEVDNAGILEYLQRRSRELRREISLLEEDVDPETAMNKSQTRIFVGGLAYNTSRYDICEMFGPIGPIVDISLPQVDRSIPADSDDAYAVRGIAFVEFADRKDARTAVELSGKFLCGRPVSINFANLNKEEKSLQAALFGDEKCLASFVPATSATFQHPTQRSLQSGVDDSVSPSATAGIGAQREGGTRKKSRWDSHDDRTETIYGLETGSRTAVGQGLRSERCGPPPSSRKPSSEQGGQDLVTRDTSKEECRREEKGEEAMREEEGGKPVYGTERAGAKDSGGADRPEDDERCRRREHHGARGEAMFERRRSDGGDDKRQRNEDVSETTKRRRRREEDEDSGGRRATKTAWDDEEKTRGGSPSTGEGRKARRGHRVSQRDSHDGDVEQEEEQESDRRREGRAGRKEEDRGRKRTSHRTNEDDARAERDRGGRSQDRDERRHRHAGDAEGRRAKDGHRGEANNTSNGVRPPDHPSRVTDEDGKDGSRAKEKRRKH